MTDPMPLALRLAAILHLTSSLALRGATPLKDAALQSHLGEALADGALSSPELQQALAELLAAVLPPPTREHATGWRAAVPSPTHLH